MTAAINLRCSSHIFRNFLGIVGTKLNPEEEAGVGHLVEGVVTMMAMAEAADMVVVVVATVEAVGKFKIIHFSWIKDVVLFAYIFCLLA